MPQGTVTPTPKDAPPRPLAPGVDVPEAFIYSEPARPGAPQATLHVRVVDRRAICERLELVPPQGEHLSSSAVRLVDLGAMFTRALYTAAQVRLYQPEPAEPDRAYWERQRLIEASIARQRGEVDRVRAAVEQRHSRQPIDLPDGGLAQVAHLYREAVALQQHPTQRIRKEFDISRSTASRWVRRARDEGLLGPSQPRKAGESSDQPNRAR